MGNAPNWSQHEYRGGLVTVYHRTRKSRIGNWDVQRRNWDVQRQEVDGLWFNIGLVAEIHRRHWQAVQGGRVVSVKETKRDAVRELISRYEQALAA